MTASAPLPPLPPVPGIDVHRPDGPSVIDVLHEDHQDLRALCDRLERGDDDGSARMAVVDVLVATLIRHICAEEQYVYPTVRVVLPDGDRLADRELRADGEIQQTVKRLDTPTSDDAGHATSDPASQVASCDPASQVASCDPASQVAWCDPASHVEVLAEVVRQVRGHIRRSERHLLPRLASVVTDEDLVRLGNRVLIAEEAAPTRAHPQTPVTPPWNKLVDPGVGVFDKVRDALAGRATRVEDL